ncbi:MAG: M15 family metallopeptidase [Ilumatobacteraceae bacterium]
MCKRTITVVALMASLCVVSPARAEEATVYPAVYQQPTMSISMTSSLSPGQVSRISAGIRLGGADPHPLRFPTVSLTAQTRAGSDIFRLGQGWRIPMATMVAPVEFVRATGGDAMAAVVAQGNLVIGETSAQIRGAQVGDVFTLRDIRFRMRTFVVGAIVADEFVNWGDLLMSTEMAARLGTMSIARIAVTGIESSGVVLAGLRLRGVTIGTTYRLRTSWDRENPDGTLGTSTTKKLLGEFAYKPTTGSSMMVSANWTSGNIVWRNRYTDIGLSNNCHKVVAVAIQGALTEIKKAGLKKHIDLRNSNRYGGCFVGRYNRMAGTFGSPSRHAWGMAIDINTVTNAQGRVPLMNCKIVHIFRKWGFAWGGNFWPADGMHFEYVGEPRDKLGYPSRYCPNPVPVQPLELPQFVALTTTTSTTSTTSTTTTSTVPETTSTTSTTTTSSTTTSTTTTVPASTTTSSTVPASTTTTTANG